MIAELKELIGFWQMKEILLVVAEIMQIKQ